MLWILIFSLALLWVLGLLASFTLGGFLHALIVLAVVLLVVRLIKGPRQRTPGHVGR